MRSGIGEKYFSLWKILSLVGAMQVIDVGLSRCCCWVGGKETNVFQGDAMQKGWMIWKGVG